MCLPGNIIGCAACPGLCLLAQATLGATYCPPICLPCRLTNTQFALEELDAIVEEAAACGTYVCAHAYTAQAIARAVRCGVRSIEHGNCLDEAAAGRVAQCCSGAVQRNGS